MTAQAASGREVVAVRVWLEVGCALLRRPRPSLAVAAALGPGVRYSLHRGSLSSIILPLAAIATCADIPLVHLLLNNAVAPPLRAGFHGTLLALNLGMLAWLFGERSAVRHIPHVLGPDLLRLRVGFRLAIDVPLPAVRQVLALQGSPREWMPALGLARRDVRLVTPMDPPNVLIETAESALAGRFLAIRVDDAEGFRRAVAAAAPQTSVRT